MKTVPAQLPYPEQQILDELPRVRGVGVPTGGVWVLGTYTSPAAPGF